MNLEQFAEAWNNGTIRASFPDDLRAFFANSCEDALLDTYETEREMRYPRVSAMGYPLLKHALLKVKPELSSFTGNGFHFMKGHLFEALVVTLMTALNMDVHSLQAEVQFEGMLGHIDGMLGDDIVFDVKALNHYYWERFTAEPDNDSGYLTQLAIYRECLGVPWGVFIAIDAWFGSIAIVTLGDELDGYLEQAYEDAQILESVKTVHDACAIAPPEPVFDPARSTKFRFVPPSLKYGPWKEFFYELKKGDKVRRVLSPREIEKRCSSYSTQAPRLL